MDTIDEKAERERFKEWLRAIPADGKERGYFDTWLAAKADAHRTASTAAQGEPYGWVFKSITGCDVLYVGAAKPEGAPDRAFPIYTHPASPASASTEGAASFAQSNDPGKDRQIGICDDGHEQFWTWIREAYRDPEALNAVFSIWNMQVAYKAGWLAAGKLPASRPADPHANWIPSADGLSWRNPAPDASPAAVPNSVTVKVTFKSGNEFAPYHPDASHVSPDYRKGWNDCYTAASALPVSRVEGADSEWLEMQSHDITERDGIVARTRRLAAIAGVPSALPEDDATVYGALFTCLGMIAAALERKRAEQPQPRFFTGQQD